MIVISVILYLINNKVEETVVIKMAQFVTTKIQ